MVFLSGPLQAAISNLPSTHAPFQGGGMDGSNEQVNNNQQGNRTVSQGDQALPSSGGTGGTQGGAAGPGGGASGAAGAGRGTAGGSNGAAGGPQVGGQETRRYNPDISPPLNSKPESRDNLDSQVLVANHSGIGKPTSDMHLPALGDFPDNFGNDAAKLGTTCPICPKKN